MFPKDERDAVLGERERERTADENDGEGTKLGVCQTECCEERGRTRDHCIIIIALFIPSV